MCLHEYGCVLCCADAIFDDPSLYFQTKKKGQHAHFSRLHELLNFSKNLGICWNFIGREGFNVYVGVIDHTLKRNHERRAPNSEKKLGFHAILRNVHFEFFFV